MLVWHVVFDCCLHLNSETRCFVAVGIAGFGAASTDDDPNGGLISMSKMSIRAGNLYGRTDYPGLGTVFKVDTAGQETVLYRSNGGWKLRWRRRRVNATPSGEIWPLSRANVSNPRFPSKWHSDRHIAAVTQSSVQLKLPLVQFCRAPSPRNAFRDQFVCISDFGSGGTARADIQIRA